MILDVGQSTKIYLYAIIVLDHVSVTDYINPDDDGQKELTFEHTDTGQFFL